MRKPFGSRGGLTIALCLMVLVLSVEGSGLLPETSYFKQLTSYVHWLNRFRTNLNELKSYTEMQYNLRTIQEPLNGFDEGTYVCFDQKRSLADSEYCNKQGMWKQGTNALPELNYWIDNMHTEKTYHHGNSVGPLRWSHSLGALASEYMETLDRCPVHWKTMVEKPTIDPQSYPFDYDDHMRIVVYPERFQWQDSQEAVWDWILDDTSTNAQWRHYLLGNRFDAIGIACNCHREFEQFCVIELGKGIRDKVPDTVSRRRALDGHLVSEEDMRPEDEVYQEFLAQEENPWFAFIKIWGTKGDDRCLESAYDQNQWCTQSDVVSQMTNPDVYLTHFYDTDTFTTRDQASLIFDAINSLRNNATNYLYGLTTKWSREEVLNNWINEGYNDLPSFTWSQGFANAARHVANEEGACGTYGDVNGDDVLTVLNKWYSYEADSIEILKVTSCEMEQLDDLWQTGHWALEYILSQDCIDKSTLMRTDVTQMGIGCGCTKENYPNELLFSCYIITGNIVEKTTYDMIPYYQSFFDWDQCSDLCPYQEASLDSIWDQLYQTKYCLNEDETTVNRGGFCQACNEQVPFCNHCSDYTWAQFDDVQNNENTNWQRITQCQLCEREVEGSDSTHYYPPVPSYEWWEQTCRFVDCKSISADGSRCEECHYFPYPAEGPNDAVWDNDNYDHWTAYDQRWWQMPFTEDYTPFDLGEPTITQIELNDDTKLWYYPLHIFYNPFDGRCTHDCKAEGRHYVNPVKYNPQDVAIWAAQYGDETTFSEFTDWSNAVAQRTRDAGFNDRRQLSNYVEDGYWRPYDPSEGPFTCECDWMNGFVHDTEMDDGRCFDCSTIHPHCHSCHFEEDEERRSGQWVCDSCSDQDETTKDEWMLSPHGNTCWPKLDNCNIDHYEQPQELNLNDEDNQWECPACDVGYYWNSDKPFGEQWTCDPCVEAIDNCIACDSASMCTVCEGDLIPNFLQNECQEPIDHCTTEDLDTEFPLYDNNGVDYVCIDCDQGYWQFDTECLECDLHDMCIDCLDNKICTLCGVDEFGVQWVVNETDTGCMPEIERCAVGRDEYQLNEDEGFWCSNCIDGYTWEWKEVDTFWTCSECGDVIEYCTNCTQTTEEYRSNCHECSGDYFPSYDLQRCQAPYENCLDDPSTYVDNVFGGDWYCLVCEDGYYWDWDLKTCTSCFEIDDNCVMCDSPDQETNIPLCDVCNNGTMVQKDQLSCTWKLDHCLDQYIENQPVGLSFDDGKYYCENCEYGYFWLIYEPEESVVGICHECIENCKHCSDEFTCDVCVEGYIPQPGGWECTPWMEQCAVPVEDQPSGLIPIAKNDTHDVWTCDPCADGYYFDYEFFQCLECDIMANCELCDAKDNCLECAGNMVVIDGNRCESNEIPGCKVYDPEDGYICLECHDFYGLSDDRHACAPCNEISDGCISCDVEKVSDGVYRAYPTCHDCATNMYLEDNACHWDECADIQFTNTEGGYINPVTCNVCTDGYGLYTVNSTCWECANPTQVWDQCKHCTIDDMLLPIDCIECMGERTLFPSSGFEPSHYCQFEAIDHCLVYNSGLERLCDTCAPTWYESGDLCLDCDIPQCQKCVEIEVEGLDPWTTCIECAEGTGLVNEWMENGYDRDVCAWTTSIDHCIEHDPTDNLNCLECEPEYYFNSEENIQECQRCDSLPDGMEGCKLCNHEGTECTECYIDFQIRFENNTCWQPECQEFIAEDSDYCITCNSGFYIYRPEDERSICVDTCPTGYYTDYDNQICRPLCSTGYTFNADYDGTDGTECVACSSVIANCTSCSWNSETPIGWDGSYIECNSCSNSLVPDTTLTATVPKVNCINPNCLTADENNTPECLVCKPGYYLTWDTRECLATCRAEYTQFHSYADSSWGPFFCGPICEDNEYNDITNPEKTCHPCGNTDPDLDLVGILDCTSCHQNSITADLMCDSCQDRTINDVDDEGLPITYDRAQFPTYDQFRCSICPVDSYEENGECHYCSDRRGDFCGRCTFLDGLFTCNECLGDVPETVNSDGEIEHCGCNMVQFVEITGGDRDTATCKNCLTEVEDCAVCSQEMQPIVAEGTFYDLSQAWYNEVRCTDCRMPYFVDEYGECTLDSCRQLNLELECIECNEKNGIVWKTQEDICVQACTYPYEEIETNICGIDCNDGYFVTGTECTSCQVAGCKHCTDVGECTYCYEYGHDLYDPDCELALTCPEVSDDLLINIPFHDYQFDSGLPTRCVKECDLPNSIWSFNDWFTFESLAFRSPSCRYCNDECIECVLSVYQESLQYLLMQQMKLEFQTLVQMTAPMFQMNLVLKLVLVLKRMTESANGLKDAHYHNNNC